MANLLNVEANGVAMGKLSSGTSTAKKFEVKWNNNFTEDVKIFGGLNLAHDWINEVNYGVHGAYAVDGQPVQYSKIGSRCFMRGRVNVYNGNSRIKLFDLPAAMVPAGTVQWVAYTGLTGAIAVLSISGAALYLNWVCKNNENVNYSSLEKTTNSCYWVDLTHEYCTNNTDDLIAVAENTNKYIFYDNGPAEATWAATGCDNNTNGNPYYTTQQRCVIDANTMRIGKSGSSTDTHGAYVVSSEVTIPEDATTLHMVYNHDSTASIRVNVGLVPTSTAIKSTDYLTSSNNTTSNSIKGILEVVADVTAQRGTTCRIVANADSGDTKSENQIYIKKIWLET